MASVLHLASYGTYEEFHAVYDPTVVPFELSPSGLGILSDALANQDAQARLAIANRLLDDGADPSLVSTSGDGVNVLHVLWGRRMDRDPEAEAALVARLLDGGADINLRSPRFGIPLRMLSQTMVVPGASANKEYMRAVFAAVTAHSRPDLTAHTDIKRDRSVGQSLALTMFGFMRDEVLAYAAATGQDIDVIS